MEMKDLNGNIRNDGNTLTVIKSLNVKVSPFVVKAVTAVKKIKLTDNPKEVDGMSIVLRTEF